MMSEPRGSEDVPEDKTEFMIRSNLEDIRSRFGALLKDIKAALSANHVTSEDAHSVLTGMFPDYTDHIPKTNLDHMFTAVTKFNLWNHLHHSPVEKLVRRFIVDHVSAMTEYKEHLSGFYATTKLIDYIKYMNSDCREGSNEVQPGVELCKRLKVKLKMDRKLTIRSLKYVQDLWEQFAEEFDIPLLTAVIDKILEGSLIVVWLVSSQVAEKISASIDKLRTVFFKRNNIISVAIGDKVVYHDKNMEQDTFMAEKLYNMPLVPEHDTSSLPSNCLLCAGHYKNPKVLPCFHVFCRECVRGLKIGSIDRFKCPVDRCDTTFTLENDDPETLPDAFPVYSKQDAAKRSEDVSKDSCRVHSGKRCESYCLDCLSFTCSKCAEEEHRNHRMKNRERAWEACKVELQERLPNVRLLNKRAASVAEDVEKTKVRVEDQQRELASSIDHTFDRLFKVLEQRKAELHRQLNDSSTDKIASLLKQQREMQNFAGRLQRLEAFTDATIEQSTDIELLTNYEFLKIQMDQYIKEGSGLSTQPLQLANLALKNSALPHVREVSHKHIRLYSKQANPSSCTAEGEGLIRAETFKVVRFHVNIHDRSHKPCTSEQDVSVLVKCLANDYQAWADVADRRHGRCEVSFCPQFRGDHEITVQVNGKQIMGSPFHLRVIMPPHQLGQSQGTIPDITGPRGITIDHQGHLLVCEWNGGRVVKLDKLARQLAEYGSGQLSHPASITLDRHGRFYVVDGLGERSKVVQFEHNGRLLRSVGKEGEKIKEFKNPRGIKINSKDEVFVCDRDNHRIQVFDLRLQFKRLIDLRALDSRLKLPAKPNDVAFDSGGTIFVTDFANHCILVLSKDEEYLYFFGNKASDDLTSPARKMLISTSAMTSTNENLAGPECITKDENDILYVTESYNHRVSVFNATGELMARFGRMGIGMGSGELRFPMGITTDRNGSVFVSDFLNNRIQIF